MFFGCRHENEDFIYQEELEEAKKKEALTGLHVAFSRDQEEKVGLCLSPHVFTIHYLELHLTLTFCCLKPSSDQRFTLRRLATRRF